MSTETWKALRRRHEDLHARDLANVEAGLYPRELLFQIPVADYVRAFPSLLLDAPRVVRRMRRGSWKDIPKVDKRRFPAYYRRTFHWQTDGYFSEHSAEVYDLGVELLFRGTADVMRRQVIPPVTRFLRSVRGLMPLVEILTGVLVIFVGVLLFFNELTIFNTYFSDIPFLAIFNQPYLLDHMKKLDLNFFDDVKNGKFSKFLVQPLGYFPYRLCSFLGQKLPGLIMILGILVLVLLGLTAFWGVNLELEPFSRIVQSWRSTEFPADSQDSRLEVRFEAIKGGTKLTLIHSDIPEGQGASYESGWDESYFQPMKLYFKPAKKTAAKAAKTQRTPTKAKAKPAKSNKSATAKKPARRKAR